MLLQLLDNDVTKLELLLTFAKKNNIQLSNIDSINDDLFLPGKPLSKEELEAYIIKSRTSGCISMKEAHQNIRSVYGD